MDYKCELQLCSGCRVSVSRGEHLALIIWRQTAPPRSLQSATQISGLGHNSLPAFLYTHTGSSAWAGAGVELSALNKQGLRSLPVSAFKWISDESGREENLFFYVDRQQCAKVRSVVQRHHHHHPPPLLRSTQTQEARWDPPRNPPCEVTTDFFTDFLHFVCVRCTASFMQHLNLQRLTKRMFYAFEFTGD